MLIGLTGFKGAGKDTAARHLAVNHGFVLRRFAGPLKAMLRAFYAAAGVPAAEVECRIEGDLKETPCQWLAGRTPRYAMQTLGTEWGRDCMARQFWVDTLIRSVERMDRVVVPDVRYPNECDAILHAGGIVWRIDAGSRVQANEFSAHSSESEIKNLPVSAVLDNSASIAALLQQINTLLGGKCDVNQLDLVWNAAQDSNRETATVT